MSFEDVYARGYRRIVLLDQEHTESASQKDDYYKESYLALDRDEMPRRVLVTAHHSIFRPRTADVTDCGPVSYEEYNRLAVTENILDSPRWSQKQADARDLLARQKALLKEVTPICPSCNRPLVLRQNRKQKNWFFGCDRYPDCDYTVSIFHNTLRRLQQAGLIT